MHLSGGIQTPNVLKEQKPSDGGDGVRWRRGAAAENMQESERRDERKILKVMMAKPPAQGQEHSGKCSVVHMSTF